MFQDLDCGPFCDAIEKVTEGVDGRDFSHIGIAEVADGGEVYVLEAVGAGVLRTPIDTFLQRQLSPEGRPQVLVGRILPQYRERIPQAIAQAEARLGKPYDETFDILNDKYYCSELVYEAYKPTGDTSLFRLYPMTFIDPDTDSTFGIWIDYYRDLGVAIPEGEPGLNPGGISRSPNITIVHDYLVGDQPDS